MTLLARIYRCIQLLSLDVVAGALFSGVMAAKVLGVRLPVIWWIALPLSVWVLYTTDHLLDALKVGPGGSNERHRFHARWIRPIGGIWMLAMLICVVYFPVVVPLELLWLGLGLGLVSGIHFFLIWVIRGVSTPWLAKEVGVAMVYTTGVWGGPAVLKGLDSLSGLWILVFQFFLLAMFNLMTFSIYEEINDEQDGFTSWVRGLGSKVSYQMLHVFNLIITLLGLVGFFLVENGWYLPVQGTFLLMLLLLNWVAWRPSVFSQQDRYRTVADGVFMIPVLWLPDYLHWI